MTATIKTRNNAAGNPVSDLWKKYSKDLVPALLGLAAFLLLWQLLSTSGAIKLPGPIQILTDERASQYIWYPFFDKGGTDKGLFWQTWESLKRVLISYSLAAVVGIGVGILIGVNPFINKALDPIFQFLRTVPPLAWVPLSLVALASVQPAALFVIFITAIWPILINTAVGVQQIPQDYLNVKQVLQLSNQKFFFKILIPSALPYIFTGLRIAIGLAWLAIIAAEIIMSGVVGIGFFIWNEYQSGYVATIILALVYIGAVGLILDRFIAWIQTLIVPGE